jgi:peptidyl-tRNA hydrolase
LNARLSSHAGQGAGWFRGYEGNKLILAKPQTYMNLSGQSIQGLARFL